MDIYDDVESTFVRKSFYIRPPEEGATEEDWKAWQKQDDKSAAVAKRKYTLSLEAEAIPESFQETAIRKINGVYRQVPSVGLVGDAQEDSCHAEPAEEARQAKVVIMSQWKPNLRGSKSSGRNARRAAARKAKAMEAEREKYNI